MKEEKYIEDLKDIRDIMDRSSRFISLSGWSGVCAGLVALGGAYAAYQIVYFEQDYLGYRVANMSDGNLLTLMGLAFLTLVLALGSGIFFTTREAKKRSQSIWDRQTRRLLEALAIPLITGGLLCGILMLKGYIGLLAPFTLIFYGLALVNASKFTLSEIKSLGLLQIGIGLIATLYIGYGLLFWSIGFGILHIVYGIIMQVKYKS